MWKRKGKRGLLSRARSFWISPTLILPDITLNGLWSLLLLGVPVKTTKAEGLDLLFYFFPS